MTRISFSFLKPLSTIAPNSVSPKMESKSDAPQAITPTDRERQAGVYSPRNLQRVLGALHRDGLVVLRDVIDKGHIDSLNAVMTEDAERRIHDPMQAFNHNVKCEHQPETRHR